MVQAGTPQDQGSGTSQERSNFSSLIVGLPARLAIWEGCGGAGRARGLDPPSSLSSGSGYNPSGRSGHSSLRHAQRHAPSAPAARFAGLSGYRVRTLLLGGSGQSGIGRGPGEPALQKGQDTLPPLWNLPQLPSCLVWSGRGTGSQASLAWASPSWGQSRSSPAGCISRSRTHLCSSAPIREVV